MKIKKHNPNFLFFIRTEIIILMFLLLTFSGISCGSGETSDQSSKTEINSGSMGSDGEESEETMIIDDKPRGYVMSFFVQTGTWIEQYPLRLAYSTDGYHWKTLNRGKAFTSFNGRDPHIFRKSDGAFVITTSGGSGMITIMDSEDLCRISAPRKMYIGPSGVIDTWAPECFSDPSDGMDMILYTVRFNEEPFHCIYYVKTSDFRTFSEPRLLLRDESADIIDASMFQSGDCFYLLFKNDYSDAIHIARSNSATGPFTYDDSVKLITAYVDGPAEGPFVIPSLDNNKFFLYFDLFMKNGHWGLRTALSSAKDLTEESVWNKQIENVDFILPKTDDGGPRHGNAVPVTGLELQKILEKWGTP